MLIPLSCDSPIYHWPFATGGLIVANVLAFILVPQLVGDDPASAEQIISWLVLEHGNGLHPIQWLTSMFVHAGFMHLAGNMLFLWIFGLVVEGKIGWWKFLIIYLGIGILQSAIEQIVMLGLGEVGYSYGASSAIYGVMAIAFVWAPKNEINCFYWFGGVYAGTLDVPIMFFAMFYLVFDMLYMVLDFASTGSLLSTGFLHILGALIGFPVGLFMVKAKMVDCEGWDLLHVWNGADPHAKPDYKQIDADVQVKKQARQEQARSAAHQQVTAYLKEGHALAAATLCDKMQHAGNPVALTREELLTLIRGLHQAKEWSHSAPIMRELINRFPDGSDPVRIKLAQIAVTELQQPALALELLAAVDFSKQAPDKVTLAKKIAHRAKQLQAEGVYELEDS